FIMTDQFEEPSSPASPDRKRSLEDESSSDEDESRGGRFKRQALNSSDSSAHPSPPRRPTSPGKSSEAPANGEGASASAQSDLAASSSSATPPAPGTATSRQPIPSFTDNSGASGHGQGHGEELAAPRIMSMRALITTKEAGIIIGKSGRNVAEIRENSGAKVTVSEQVPGAHERILTITGPLDTVAKAFSLVALKMVEEQQTTMDVKARHTAVRVLVPHSRMGSVIGKQGLKIKEIQDASGARVTASEEILPQSTERTVTVQGVVDSIHIATYHIGLVLQEHQERSAGTIPYKPQPMRGGPPHQYGPGGPPGYGGHPAPPPSPHPPGGYYGGPPNGPGPMGGMGMPHPRGPPGPPHMGMGMGGGPPMMAPPGAVQMQQIFIPNEMVGAIIGKGGSKINEIRHLSGCQIKIAEPSGASAERLVTITGTPEANQMALYLLYSRLEAEKARLGGRGSDDFSEADSKAFFKSALEIQNQLLEEFRKTRQDAEGWNGVPTISHETHRGRILFNPWTTYRLLQEFEDLYITLDVSHWHVVCERLLVDDEGNQTYKAFWDLVAARTRHIHARVGSPQSPQVPDPSDQHYSRFTAAHQKIWEKVWDAQRAKAEEEGKVAVAWSTLTPEYGPVDDGYMPVFVLNAQDAAQAEKRGPLKEIDPIIFDEAARLRNRFSERW
ncbi:hypothetical protein HK102_004948, partial [Quaeritorhiza haematococci]